MIIETILSTPFEEAVALDNFKTHRAVRPLRHEPTRAALKLRAFNLNALLCMTFMVWLGLGVSPTRAQTRTLNLPLEILWEPVRSIPSLPSTDEAKDQGGASAGLVKPNTQERLSVGAGDQIFITVFGQPDMSAEVTVNDNQQVTLPLIGTLKVGGLSPASIEKLLAQRLKDGEYLRNPEVSVQVRQVRSQMILVMGEVQRPGRFALSGKLTVLDALATAGGLTPRADHTIFLLRRNSTQDGDKGDARQEIAIQLDQRIDARRGDIDLELKNDDVVFVAQQKLFYIHGEVRKPGAYPIEADLDLMRALAISGGVTERGSLRRIKIHRKGADLKMQVLTPDLSSLIFGGDVVYIDERLF